MLLRRRTSPADSPPARTHSPAKGRLYGRLPAPPGGSRRRARSWLPDAFKSTRSMAHCRYFRGEPALGVRRGRSISGESALSARKLCGAILAACQSASSRNHAGKEFDSPNQIQTCCSTVDRTMFASKTGTALVTSFSSIDTIPATFGVATLTILPVFGTEIARA